MMMTEKQQEEYDDGKPSKIVMFTEPQENRSTKMRR